VAQIAGRNSGDAKAAAAQAAHREENEQFQMRSSWEPSCSCPTSGKHGRLRLANRPSAVYSQVAPKLIAFARGQVNFYADRPCERIDLAFPI